LNKIPQILARANDNISKKVSKFNADQIFTSLINAGFKGLTVGTFDTLNFADNVVIQDLQTKIDIYNSSREKLTKTLSDDTKSNIDKLSIYKDAIDSQIAVLKTLGQESIISSLESQKATIISGFEEIDKLKNLQEIVSKNKWGATSERLYGSFALQSATAMKDVFLDFRDFVSSTPYLSNQQRTKLSQPLDAYHTVFGVPVNFVDNLKQYTNLENQIQEAIAVIEKNMGHMMFSIGDKLENIKFKTADLFDISNTDFTEIFDEMQQALSEMPNEVDKLSASYEKLWSSAFNGASDNNKLLMLQSKLLATNKRLMDEASKGGAKSPVAVELRNQAREIALQIKELSKTAESNIQNIAFGKLSKATQQRMRTMQMERSLQAVRGTLFDTTSEVSQESARIQFSDVLKQATALEQERRSAQYSASQTLNKAMERGSSEAYDVLARTSRQDYNKNISENTGLVANLLKEWLPKLGMSEQQYFEIAGGN